MAATNTIIIERESGFSGALMPMHIVIDDIQSIHLSNGEHKKIKIPTNKKECTLQVKDHVFKVVNLKQVKKIVLKFGFTGIECSILYHNGNILDAINKNPGADVTKTIMIILLIFVVLVLPLSQCSSVLFLY